MSDEQEAGIIDQMRAEFDDAFYLAMNKDVAEAGADPFSHFLTFGWREGRDPNSAFSIRRYVDLNADVKEAGANGFAHYLAHGRAEGRPTDHGLGFQYEVLWVEPTVEERIQRLRTAIPDRAPDPSEQLVAAVATLAKGRPVHCTVSHDNPVTGVGGIQLCIRLEARAFQAAGHDHIHIYPTAAAVAVDVEREAPTLGVLINGVSAGHFTPETVAGILGPVVSQRTASFAVHSLIGHPVDRTIEVLKAMGMRAGFYWLHDFASLCAGYTLMRNDVAFCGAPPPDSTACEVCAYGRRRRVQLPAHADFFQAFDITVVSPSSSALDLWRVRFPVEPAAMLVHPHADLEPREAKRAARRTTARPLRIAFLGMPTVHKGWPVFSTLVKRFADDPRYEFHHLAKQRDPRVAARFTKVEPTAKSARPMIDAVERLDIDVAILWSLWPETFCFAAYEGVAGGAAIVTNPDAGHVVRFVESEADGGRVLQDEASLEAFFESGEALGLARATRQAPLYDLSISGMTADLVLKAGQ